MAEDICYFDENTLVKVRDTLRGVIGMGEYQAEAVIIALQNKGILFRERLPYIHEDREVRIETAGSGSGAGDEGQSV